MFCIFSPEYKLMGEQCYWFADVILRAVQKRRPEAYVVKGEKFFMAGKYGSISVPLSASTRSELVETFETLASFEGITPTDESEDAWWHNRHHVFDFLVLLISSFPGKDSLEFLPVTAEVLHRAAGALVRITSLRLANQRAAYSANTLSPALNLFENDSAEI
jgi:putative lipoic acid-binding regulatory protein